MEAVATSTRRNSLSMVLQKGRMVEGKKGGEHTFILLVLGNTFGNLNRLGLWCGERGGNGQGEEERDDDCEELHFGFSVGRGLVGMIEDF